MPTQVGTPSIPWAACEAGRGQLSRGQRPAYGVRICSQQFSNLLCRLGPSARQGASPAGRICSHCSFWCTATTSFSGELPGQVAADWCICIYKIYWLCQRLIAGPVLVRVCDVVEFGQLYRAQQACTSSCLGDSLTRKQKL